MKQFISPKFGVYLCNAKGVAWSNTAGAFVVMYSGVSLKVVFFLQIKFFNPRNPCDIG